MKFEKGKKFRPRSLFENYKEYLYSDIWKSKRDTILKRTPLCKDCGKKATAVHHLNYDHVTNEGFRDLVGLCSKCHDKRHGLK